MRLKKAFFLGVLVIIISFGIISCSGTGTQVTITYDTARTIFLTWIGEQDSKDESVGMFLSEVQAGETVGAEVIGEGTSSIRQARELSKGGWLFYLDEAPGGFYNHPGKILVIGKNGDKLYEKETVGRPVVNGEPPEVLTKKLKERFVADYVIWNPVEIYIPDYTHIVVDIILYMKSYGAVVVNGLRPSESLYSEASDVHDDVVDAMEQLMGPSYVEAVDYPDNATIDIQNAVQTLIDDHIRMSNITIYIVAHGGHQYMSVGGTGFSTNSLVTLMNAYPNINFSVIIETCHGGSWTDYFDGLATPHPNLDLFIASTRSDQGAYPDYDTYYSVVDHNGADDQYVEFTSDFLLQIDYYTQSANWPTVTGLTYPTFANNYLKLYYLAFKKVKTNNPGANSLVIFERSSLNFQSPQIYF